MATKRFDLLDNIKGLMIFFIIITHFRFTYPEDYLRYGFFYWVDMAVPVFMIITGYLNAISLEKNESVRQAYMPERIIKKLLRFLIPWVPVVLVEIPILVIVKNLSTIDIVTTIIGGGTGLVHITHLL